MQKIFELKAGRDGSEGATLTFFFNYNLLKKEIKKRWPGARKVEGRRNFWEWEERGNVRWARIDEHKVY